MLVLALFACSLAPDTFVEREDHLLCVRWRRCEPEAFADFFRSLEECETTWNDYRAPELACRQATCTFDEAAARDCLQAIRTADCVELYDDEHLASCEAPWTACDDVAYEACVMSIP